MKTAFFLFMSISSILFLIGRLLRLPPSRNIGSIDAIVPAFNEELCVARTIVSLLRNRYIRRVICVDDGSTDRRCRFWSTLPPAPPGSRSCASKIRERAGPS